MSRFAGRAAVVTGAAGGIGKAIALALAGEGARVLALDIDAERLAGAYSSDTEPGVTPVRCDVTDRSDVGSAIDAFSAMTGGVDILVNNAVMFHYAPLEDFDPAIAARMLDVGVKGTLWNSQVCTPHMKRRGGGAVINLSSIAVSMAIPNAAVYTAIKGAVDALTRQQAAELGPHGIRVNALAPGSVPTPGANSVIDAAGWKSREAKTVLGRLPAAEDIARAAVFLASDDSSCITGVTLKVDAGMTIIGP